MTCKPLAIALFAVATSNASTIVFSDGNFTSGWSNTTIADQNTATGSTSYVTTNPATGGYPNFFRQEAHSSVQATGAPTLAAVEWANLNSAANYDPSSQGAIASLAFSYDLLDIDDFIAGFRQVNVGYGLIAAQNGRFYRAYFGDIGGNTWTSYSYSGLTSVVFNEVLNSGTYPHLNTSSHPDFSAAGSNIRFGYLVGNGFSRSINGNTGIDNWSVTITNNETPEPASIGAIGAGLIGLAALGRKRKGGGRN